MEAVHAFTEVWQNLTATQVLFCETLMGTLAAHGAAPSRHPAFDERPSVSAHNLDWVND